MAMEASQGPSIVRARYGTYTDSDHAEFAVQVRGTDFNGTDWDGCPFSATPEWLQDAVKNRALSPHTRGHTDYAEWDVVTMPGVRNATPGDWIIRRENGELAVVDGEVAHVLINLRPPPPGSADRG